MRVGRDPAGYNAPMKTRIEVPVGRETWTLDVRPEALLEPRRAEVEPPAAGPRELVRAALDAPRGLGSPLHRALTPDDHVAVVIDDRLPHLGELLAGVIEHVGRTGVAPAAVTLIAPPGAASESWLADRPGRVLRGAARNPRPGRPEAAGVPRHDQGRTTGLPEPHAGRCRGGDRAHRPRVRPGGRVRRRRGRGLPGAERRGDAGRTGRKPPAQRPADPGRGRRGGRGRVAARHCRSSCR